MTLTGSRCHNVWSLISSTTYPSITGALDCKNCRQGGCRLMPKKYFMNCHHHCGSVFIWLCTESSHPWLGHWSEVWSRGQFNLINTDYSLITAHMRHTQTRFLFQFPELDIDWLVLWLTWFQHGCANKFICRTRSTDRFTSHLNCLQLINCQNLWNL